jgi:hypothetical protein
MGVKSRIAAHILEYGAFKLDTMAASRLVHVLVEITVTYKA